MNCFVIMAVSGINGKENVYYNSHYRTWIVCIVNDEVAASKYLEKLNAVVKPFTCGTYLGNKVELLTKATSDLDPNSNHSSLGTMYLAQGPYKIKWSSEI